LLYGFIARYRLRNTVASPLKALKIDKFRFDAISYTLERAFIFSV
jgi:hypothetical protein